MIGHGYRVLAKVKNLIQTAPRLGRQNIIIGVAQVYRTLDQTLDGSKLHLWKS